MFKNRANLSAESGSPDLTRRRLLLAGVSAPVIAALEACGGGSDGSVESLAIYEVSADSTGKQGEIIEIGLPEGVASITSVKQPSTLELATAQSSIAQAKSANGAVTTSGPSTSYGLRRSEDNYNDEDVYLEGRDKNGRSCLIKVKVSCVPTLVTPVTLTIADTASNASGEMNVRPAAKEAKWGTLPSGFTGGAIAPKGANGSQGANAFTFSVAITSAVTSGTYTLPVALKGANGKSSVVSITVVVNKVTTAPDVEAPTAPTVLSLGGTGNAFTADAITSSLEFNEKISALEVRAYIKELSQVITPGSLAVTIDPVNPTLVAISIGNFPYSGTYNISVRATDAASNQSGWYAVGGDIPAL